MSALKVGQVLWLVFRFNNTGTVSDSTHPYVITSISDAEIGLVQLDSLKEGNRLHAFSKHSKVVYCSFPAESVIQTDSYAQLNNRFSVDNYSALIRYRQSENTLSDARLDDLLSAYNDYHATYAIDENRIVHMSQEEVEELNP